MKIASISLLFIMGISPTGADYQQQQQQRQAYILEETEERRVWVHYKEGQHDACMQSIQAMTTAFSSSSLSSSLPPSLQVHYDFNQSNSIVLTASQDVLAQLESDPNVMEIVEDPPRFLMYLPDSVQERYLQADQQEIPYNVELVQAPQAWKAGVTGKGVKVCVIDTGMDATHPDFAQERVSGLDTMSLDWRVDGVGHGTHVSGTIAAADNGIGVVGIAPDAELFTIKVFSDNGQFVYSSGIVDAANRCVEAGAKVISMSLGGPLPNIFEFQSFEEIFNQGVLPVAAAGNSGLPWFSFPASYQGVMSVAALDSNKKVADFSQRNFQVDLAAPGVDVLSTLPTDGNCLICEKLGVKTYGTVSGTSMATPAVSGVAALLWSLKPNASIQEVERALVTSAEDLGAPGKDSSYGNGLVSAMSALEILNGGPLETIPPEPTPAPIADFGCDKDEILVIILLQTDGNGEDTYWDVRRDTDNFVVLADAGFESQELYEVERCLPVDCYTFTIYDFGGDGICCNNGQGSFSVTVDGQEIGSGAEFLSTSSLSFGQCSENGDETKEIKISPSSCVGVELFLRTDQHPLETVFSLINEGSAETVFASNDLEPNQDYEFSDCIDPSGCYLFDLDDTHGDGLCCEHGHGYYQLVFNGKLVAAGSKAATHELGAGCD